MRGTSFGRISWWGERESSSVVVVVVKEKKRRKKERVSHDLVQWFYPGMLYTITFRSSTPY